MSKVMETNTYKPYPAYKNTEARWLGNVPDHWSITRLKYTCNVLDGKRIPLDAVARNDMQGNIPYWGANGVVDYVNKSLFSEELVLLGEDGAPFFDKSKNVAFYVTEEVWVNNHIHVLRPYSTVYAKFLAHVLNCVDYRDYVDGSTRDKLTQGKMVNIPVQLPPFEEQIAISNFLDRKVKKIDEIIADKERLLALLAEQRQAIISEAVTKGLNPNVKMKDSGIEWLGEVPQHWEVSRLDRVASVKARLGWKGLTASEYVDDGFIFLATPNIKQTKIDFDNVNYITSERYYESPEIMLELNDVLLAKDGSTLGTVNVIRELPRPATVNSSIAVIRPNENLNGVFLQFFLASNYMQNIIQRMKDGMGVPHLFQRDINKFTVLVPPIEEQSKITDILENKLSVIEEVIEELMTQIKRLTNYRQSLISEAVTGKIDVREVNLD